MADATLDSLLSLATLLAEQSTRIALRSFGAAGSTLKSDRTVVTEVDHEIQAHILEGIAANFPDHAVIAEEAVRTPGAHANMADARYCWVVDPLDGTRNFALGFACFATSIAVLDRGEPVAAVVVEHNIRATYTATKGGGAFLNGQRIHAGVPPEGHDWMIGVPSSKDELSVRAVSKWSATRGLICRNLGTAAYHLALVACGAFAGTFCKQCKIWDVAAGILLVTEAGGVCTGANGEPLTPFRLDRNFHEDIPAVAASREAHAILIGTLSDRVNHQDTKAQS